MSKFESIINSVPDEFESFIIAMATEYNNHRLKQGDSWKYCNKMWLYKLWRNSIINENLGSLIANPSHLIDIANFCWFLWYRLKEDESNQYKMKG